MQNLIVGVRIAHMADLHHHNRVEAREHAGPVNRGYDAGRWKGRRDAVEYPALRPIDQYTVAPQTAMTRCARIFTKVRDGLEPLVEVEVARGHVIFRDNLSRTYWTSPQP